MAGQSKIEVGLLEDPRKRDLREAWEVARHEHLAPPVVSAVSQGYLQASQLVEVDGRLVIEVSSPFAADWMERKYRGPVTNALGEVLPGGSFVGFRSNPALNGAMPVAAREVEGGCHNGSLAPTSQGDGVAPAGLSPLERSRHWPLPVLNLSMTLDSLVPHAGNMLAIAACQSLLVAETGGIVYVYGAPGFGKTHLLNAIGLCFLAEQAKVEQHYPAMVHVTAEVFRAEFLAMVGDKNPKARGCYKRRWEEAELLVIDGLESLKDVYIQGKATAKALTEVLQIRKHAGRKTVLACTERMREMGNLFVYIADAVLAELKAPDLQAKTEATLAYAQTLNPSITEEMVVGVLSRVSVLTGMRPLRGAMTLLHQYLKMGAAITEEVLDEIAGQYSSLERGQLSLYSRGDCRIKPEDVISAVLGSDEAKGWAKPKGKVTSEHIRGEDRSWPICRLRDLVVHLCREVMVEVSYSTLGDILGGRDHSTIQRAAERISKALLRQEQPLVRIVSRLKAQLEQAADS